MRRKQKRKQPRPEARRRAAHQRQSETPHRTQRKAGRMMQNGKIKKGRSGAAQQHREKIPVNAERRARAPSKHKCELYEFRQNGGQNAPILQSECVQQAGSDHLVVHGNCRCTGERCIPQRERLREQQQAE